MCRQVVKKHKSKKIFMSHFCENNNFWYVTMYIFFCMIDKYHTGLGIPFTRGSRVKRLLSNYLGMTMVSLRRREG